MEWFNLGTIGIGLIAMTVSDQAAYLLSLSDRKVRELEEKSNKRILELRSIPFKSIEQQKEYLQLANRRSVRSKTRMFSLFVFRVAVFMLVFFGLLRLFGGVNIGVAIVFTLVCPIVLGLILQKYGLGRNNPLLNMLRSIIGGRE